MTDRSEIRDSDLHAYVDGALDPVRRAEVEAALGQDTALAAKTAAFRGDKVLIKRVYAPLAERPIPKEWIALAHGGKAPAKSWRPAAAIAAVLVLALVSALGYWRSMPQASGEIVQAALEARERPVHAERIVEVAAGADARQYDAVLKSVVAMNVKVPDLGRMGYRLTGLHLYAKAAELLYRDGNGRVFTLYLRHSDGAARFDQFARADLRVCVWQDEELGMVMAGNVSTASMQRLASLAYTGLTL